MIMNVITQCGAIREKFGQKPLHSDRAPSALTLCPKGPTRHTVVIVINATNITNDTRTLTKQSTVEE